MQTNKKRIHWPRVVSICILLLAGCTLIFAFHYLKNNPQNVDNAILPIANADDAPYWSTPAIRLKNDVAVLNAALSRYCGSSGNAFYVLSSTAASDHPDDANLKGPYADAMLDMYERSPAYYGSTHATKPYLVPQAVACNGLKLASEEVIITAFENHNFDSSSKPEYRTAGWEGFYGSFPGSKGLVGVSLPGYSKNADHATVYIRSNCGRLCGSGFTICLQYSDGKWKVTDSLPAWIS